MTKVYAGQEPRYETWAYARRVEKYQKQQRRERREREQRERQVRREMNRRQQQNRRQNRHREIVRANRQEMTRPSPAVLLANARHDVAAARTAVEALASASRGAASGARAAAGAFRSAPLNADEEEEEVGEEVEDGESMIIESDEEGDDDAPSVFDGAGLGWVADDSAADLRAPGLLRDYASYGRLFNGVRRGHPIRF